MRAFFITLVCAYSISRCLYGADSYSVTQIAGVSILGASDQHAIGYQLDGCGDVNADGFGDFVLGTRRLAGSFHSNIGYLLSGSRVLSGTIDLVTLPRETLTIAHDHLGEITVAAGDFNGDGLSDVVFADCLGSPFGIPSAGRVVMVFGGEDLPEQIEFDDPGTPALTIPGYRRNGSLGYVMSRAGDVNGDELPDLLIGSPGRYLQTDDQEAFLIYGATDLPASLDLADLGPRGVRMVGRNFGWDVAGAGDVNGDGLDDILVTAFGNVDDELGRGYLIYGATDLPGEISQADVTSLGVDFTGEQIDDAFGLYGAGAGDINGDGYDDILLSAGCGGSLRCLRRSFAALDDEHLRTGGLRYHDLRDKADGGVRPYPGWDRRHQLRRDRRLSDFLRHPKPCR
jgi:hypothetical protein